MEVLFTFRIKEDEEEALKVAFPKLHFHFDKTVTDDEIEAADVLVTFGSDVDEEVLNRARCLKWIMVASAGMENLPLSELENKGILVTNVRGIHKIPMAESVLAHILALQRAIIPMYEQQQKSKWSRKFERKELKGSRAIILGPGAIGSEIGRLLQAFGVHTIGCNRSGKQSKSMNETIVFDQLLDNLPEADFVISVLPSTPETINLLTAAHFDTMKETAVFMNFGRGNLFDEAVLINALKNNQIGHAVLDVFQVEPLPATSEFWSLRNCTVSPHTSSLSSKYVERSLAIFHKNLRMWLEGGGDMLNVIDLGQGY